VVKRLEQGTFKFPAAADAAAAAGLRRAHKAGDHGLEIDADDLALLLEGIDLASIKRAPRYRRDPSNGRAGAATNSESDHASATP